MLFRSDIRYNELKEARKRESSLTFERTNSGFHSSIQCNKQKYAFFSVPYDTGWKATVNNQEVPIYKTNGFMSVPVDAGTNNIQFNYNVPGAKIGVILSFISLFILCIISGFEYMHRKY